MPKNKLPSHILAELLSTPWLITGDWLQTIYTIACRENTFDVDALTAKRASRMENTNRAKRYNDVAVIPISGPIFPKANLMTEFSGATSLESVARDLQLAMDDDDIARVILDIDSPGGHVTGVNEMANIIHAHAGIKDIQSYISGTGASAAYWIASPSSEIIVDATSRVGSIGVVVGYPKDDGSMIEIVNSASPNKRPDVSTEEGKKVVEEQMNMLADVFIEQVAKFRNVSVSTVKNDFGRGGILVGEHAVKAGMADRIGSFDELLNEDYGGKSMPAKSTTAATALTLTTLKADHPTVYNEAVQVGVDSCATEMSEKDNQIQSLTDQLASATTTNTELSGRVSKLEKNEIVRQEQSIAATADGIFSASLSASSIPARLYPKIAAPSHEESIVDGKLDRKDYQTKVNAEITEWEESLSDTSETVQGFGHSQRTVSDTDTVSSDDAADDLLGVFK